MAFKLYDTYGFPLDLTQDALRAKNFSVDLAGFDAAMAKQKADARAAWSGSGDASTETRWFAVRDTAGATDFLGYATERVEAKVMAIVKDGIEVERASAGDEAAIVLNQTPFYGESGGQVGDTGVMLADGVRFAVTDTQKKLGNLFVHGARSRRARSRKAWRSTASSTMRAAEDPRQSFGDPPSARGAAPHARRPYRAEGLAGGAGAAALRLLAPKADPARRARGDRGHRQPRGARERRGADAADGHRGGAQDRRARLVRRESTATRCASSRWASRRATTLWPTDPHGPAFSVELCGGTHVARTGDIGLITIVGESAVASGVRRVEAKTGAAARHHLNARAEKLDALAGLLKTPEDEAAKRLAALLDERKKLDRELSDARKKLAMGGGGGEAPAFAEIGGVKYLGKAVSGVEMKDLKALADEAKQSLGSGIVAIVGIAADGKAGVVVGVTQDLTPRFDAVALVRAAAAELGGKGGGGRRDMAQAGGPDGQASQKALDAVGAMLEAA